MTKFGALLASIGAGLAGIAYTAAKIRKVAGFIDFFARLPAEQLRMQASLTENTAAIRDLTAKLQALTDVEARRGPQP